MKQLKKTLLTLALLIAAVSGAWAQTEITTIPNGDFETWTYDGEDMPNYWNSNATSDGSLNGFYGGKQLKRSTDVRPGSSGQYSCSIWSKSTMGVINIGILTSGRIHFGSASSIDKANYIYSDRDGSNTKNNVTNPCAMPFTGKPTAVKVWVKYVQGGTGYGEYATAKFSATIHGDADYVAYNLAEDDNDDNKALVVASAEQEIAYNNGEWEQLTIPFNYTDNDVAPAYILINAYTNAYPGKGKANDYLYIDDIELEYAASAPSGPEVAWDKATKTGTFTMPGGNVTLEPEYYPQATVADGGVTAADADARATTDDPLVKVDATKLTGAKKLMYFVSNSGTAPAYDAEGWTDQLPTAEGITQQGIVYVWYYPVGTDEGVDGATATYSDGDICLQSITARIAAAPAPDLSHTLADGSYYVKNGALSLYMAAGGSYGTQGIVNERGLDLIFTYNSGTKTYTIDSRLDNGGNNHFLNSGLYMDAPSFGWTVEGENSFTISANLDGVKHYLAVDENNNLVYTEDGTAENAQWIIVPKADHENAVLAAGLNAMKAATAENGVDATFLIACPGFNRNDKRNAEAWTVEANRLAMGGAGSEGNGCADSYNSTFTLSQTLSNAPAGVYTLTAQGFYRQNGSDNENLPYFYANDEKQTFKLLEDQVYNMEGAGPLFTQGKYTIDPITVVVAEDGALTIGAKLETNTQLWSCWDNFKLTYYGPVMYSVTFADDTAEPTLWTASPNTDVKKGTEVTVTYSGTKKVIGVKAEKKAAAAPTWDGPIASEATAADIGKVVCAAGHLHDAKTAVPDGCTAVGILGKVTETGHGLILALKDATAQTWNTINGWTSASYASTTLKVLPDDAARGTNLTSYTTLGETTVSNWAVAQKSDYEAIFTNLGSTKSDDNGTTYDGNVNAYITTGVGGTAIYEGWSATGYNVDASRACRFYNLSWGFPKKTNSHSVRPVLGF